MSTRWNYFLLWGMLRVSSEVFAQRLFIYWSVFVHKGVCKTQQGRQVYQKRTDWRLEKLSLRGSGTLSLIFKFWKPRNVKISFSWRGCGSNGHNTLSGVPFGQLSCPLARVWLEFLLKHSPCRFSMVKIVGRKAHLKVFLEHVFSQVRRLDAWEKKYLDGTGFKFTYEI